MNTIHVYSLHHSVPLEDKKYMAFLSELPVNFQTAIKAYKFRESAEASLLGKIVLLHALKKDWNLHTLKDLQEGERERLYMHGFPDFNISHSGEHIIVAIAGNGRTGIDIEKHRSLNIELFKKYFSDEEWADISGSGNDLHSFFKYWAIKESAIKCDGRGVEILSKTKVTALQKDSGTLICDQQEFYFQLLNIDPQYACAVSCNLPFEIVFEKICAGMLAI